MTILTFSNEGAMHRGISVQEILRKSDASAEPRLTVVRGVASYEDSGSHWMADRFIQEFKKQIPGAQVAEVYLSTFTLVDGASNDPDDKAFDPRDQLPAIFEPIKRADVLLLVSRETCGFPDANTVRLIARLKPFAQASENREKKLLLDNKPAAVLVYGGGGVCSVAKGLAAVVNKWGATLVRHGFVYHDRHRGPYEKDEKLAATIERVAGDLAELCRNIHH